MRFAGGSTDAGVIWVKEYVVGEIARFTVIAREPLIGVRRNLVVCVFSLQMDVLLLVKITRQIHSDLEKLQ